MPSGIRKPISVIPGSVEHLPSGSDWELQFPDYRLVRAVEGGSVFAAQEGKEFVLIVDERGQADFLEPEEAASMDLLTVLRFGSEASRSAYLASSHPVLGGPLEALAWTHDISPLALEQVFPRTAWAESADAYVPLDSSVGAGDEVSASQPQVLITDPVLDVGLAVITFEKDGDVEVAEFTLRWDGPWKPRHLRRNGSIALLQGGFGQSEVERAHELGRLLKMTVTRRRRRFRRCESCKNSTAPEFWDASGACFNCSPEPFGTLY